MSYIEELEREWSNDGVLGKLRDGNWSPDSAEKLLALLKSIEISDDASVPKRAISLLWYIPSFLSWQRERVGEHGGNLRDYDMFVVGVHNVLEEALGIP
ncbi:hypothetical protein [Bradyrhizobium sp. HKCCYLS20291]|uniref:hypothetical protein n=1 Tax=Bradyrhizobium sp. HKCCYLS20291 TaxID=3420766 RepID=UPI003EB8D39D